ncbi:MAG: lipid-A-disaccharide synthase-related protein [Cyanobacteriota bacterium]
MSKPALNLLLISNGHGEDLIAAKILQSLKQLAPEHHYAVLPLVGEGRAYGALAPLLVDGQTLPSGGFIYMDSRQLWRDLRSGLGPLTLRQFQATGRWARAGGKVAAVGDIVPLLMAWESGADYAFVGTAKSDYYLQGESGFRRRASDYYPWERWLLSRPQCRGVLARDRLTCKGLRRLGIQSDYAGNPMMDGLEPRIKVDELLEIHPTALKLVLLPGSRAPEAQENWRLMLQALPGFAPRPLTALAALAPGLTLEPFLVLAREAGWSLESPLPPGALTMLDPQIRALRQGEQVLILSQGAYPEALHWADAALAMAGTATEQVVGLGKPAATLMGAGPQFNPIFARRQTFLLGESVLLASTPEQVAPGLLKVLADPRQLSILAANGRARLGPPGGAEGIARKLLGYFGADLSD